MTHEVRLSLPAQQDFHPVAHLVVGGLAARRDLTYDVLEDLQVALDALLACRDDDGDIVVSMSVDGGEVRASIGPFSADALAQLDRGPGELPLRRVLQTVLDDVSVEDRDGGSWIDVKKRIGG